MTHLADLAGSKQLPGLAIQRLMEKGYGFGAEGDWKTAAMVRIMKIMTQGMKDAKGTSFMEDYTYNLVPGKERYPKHICRKFVLTIADARSEIPLSMGYRNRSRKTCIYCKRRTSSCYVIDSLGCIDFCFFELFF